MINILLFFNIVQPNIRRKAKTIIRLRAFARKIFKRNIYIIFVKCFKFYASVVGSIEKKKKKLKTTERLVANRLETSLCLDSIFTIAFVKISRSSKFAQTSLV